MSFLKALQNGSDIRGIAITTKKHQANFTQEEIKKISFGFVNWLKQKEATKYQEGNLTADWNRSSFRVSVGWLKRL